MRKAPSPAPSVPAKAISNKPRTARCSSMKSRPERLHPGQAPSRPAADGVSRLGSNKLIPLRARLILPPTRIWVSSWPKANSVRISFYRINVMRIDSPQLQERSEDIPSSPAISCATTQTSSKNQWTRSNRQPWRCSRTTLGPAMCASLKTSCSVPSSWLPATWSALRT